MGVLTCRSRPTHERWDASYNGANPGVQYMHALHGSVHARIQEYIGSAKKRCRGVDAVVEGASAEHPARDGEDDGASWADELPNEWSIACTGHFGIVCGWMTLKAWQFWRAEGQKGTARGLFWASIWHLPIVMVLAMAQKKGLGERIYRSIFGYADIDEEDLYYEAGELEEEEQKQLAVVEGRRAA